MRFFGAFLSWVPVCLLAQTPVIILTTANERASTVTELARLQESGVQVSVVVGPGVYLAQTPVGSGFRALPYVRQVVDAGSVKQDLGRLEGDARLAATYLLGLIDGRFDGSEARAAMSWQGRECLSRGDGDHHGPGPRSDRDIGADWACAHTANSERLIGTVAASTFFIESNGAVDADLYTWTPAAIEEVKLGVIDAWSIWSYTAAQYGHPLTAIMDWHEPAGGLTVQGYEPVLHPSTQDHLWLDAIMTNMGRMETGMAAKVHGFNQDRRSALGTDQAFSAFFAYNPPASGAPNQFTDGKIGYAVIGGPYVQLLYKANGWSVTQIPRVYGHELGHVFHAFDEYAGAGVNNCTRSFNGRQNLNFHGGTCNGNAVCVMLDNSFTGTGATRQWTMCAHTPYHLGWSGTLPPADPIAPIDDVMLTSGNVTLSWDPHAPPEGVIAFVRVIERSTAATIFCGEVKGTQLELTLLNGQYAWTVALGKANTSNGYAGIVTSPAFFQVGAPLDAHFQASTNTVCPGTGVLFTDLSTGAPISWTWNFPGGEPSTFSGQHPPLIVYDVPGTYPVELAVSDGSSEESHVQDPGVEVTGGAPLPAEEGWETGIFPPDGWGLPVLDPQAGWVADGSEGCGSTVSAVVYAFPLNSTWRTARMTSPLFDLTTALAPYVRFRYSYAQASASATEVLVVSAGECGHPGQEDLLELSGSGLATNGGAYLNSTGWQPTACTQWRDTTLSLQAFAGTVMRLTFDLVTMGGQNVWLDDIVVFEAARIPIRLKLQGPFDAGTGLMRDDLRMQGILPLTEPYSIGGGGESTSMDVLEVSGTNAIVDWVIVELRDPLTPSVVRTSRAALVQRDGDVVDVDGTTPLVLPDPPTQRYIAVRHRNHLGVMSAAPITLGPTTPLLDISDPATALWGVNACRQVNGTAVLWGGDARSDGHLSYIGENNDRDAVLLRIGGVIPTAVVEGYWPEDCTMDGAVLYTGEGNDRDVILLNIGPVPTAVRTQQIP